MKRILGEKGQGLTEYAVLLCLIGVSSIAVVSYFGASIKSKLTSIAYAISGNKDASNTSKIAADKAAAAGQVEANKVSGMEINESEVIATEKEIK